MLREKEREAEAMRERAEEGEREVARLTLAEEGQGKEEARVRERLQRQLEERSRDTEELEDALDKESRERERLRVLERELEEDGETRRKEQAELMQDLQGTLGRMEREKARLVSELREREEEVKRWRSRCEKLEGQAKRRQPEIDSGKEAGEVGGAPEGVSLEGLRARVSTLLLEKDERETQLRERESEVYALRRRVADLTRDRERFRTALEKTEASLIWYREKSRQLGQSRKSGPDTNTSTQEPRQQAQSEEGPGGGADVQERLLAMQKAVARLEFDQKQLQARNVQLEQRVARLRTERGKLRDMLKELEQEREKFLHQLSRSDSATRDSSRIQGESSHMDEGEEKLHFLRARVMELEEQVLYLRKTLAADHKDRAEFIEQSSRNNQWLVSLRKDLNDSLAVVSQKPVPSVLEAETQRLDKSLREEELRLSLSQS
ncbi:hypothetical protein AAFF_G00211530 [Aldrovandia affinis]|uniref:Uncharacterized protein n=1 Tax=Aldrovandia affinis TaxID=143900 RepID=A0AAD7WUV6_9TELE|nr:hypothetical protein AAFF_G00211530 [Aldrovandia affinis]